MESEKGLDSSNNHGKALNLSLKKSIIKKNTTTLDSRNESQQDSGESDNNKDTPTNRKLVGNSK